MPHNPRAPQESPVERAHGDLAIIGTMLVAFAHIFTVPLRTRVGHAAYRNTVFAIPMMLAYAVCAPCPEILVYCPIWILCVACRKVDRTQHSQYGGWPWLTGLFTKHELRARQLEPVFLGVFGVYLCTISESLGLFVLCGATAVMMILMTEMKIIRKQKEAFLDARVSTEQFTRLHQGGTGWD